MPKDWELAEPPICTPPFSIVKYQNGIVFSSESNRFQLIDNNPPENFDNSEVTSLAVKYLRTLPHVRYTAVGINFSGSFAHAQPQEFLIERFLKTGGWNDNSHKPKAVGFHFVYPAVQGILNLRAYLGVVTKADHLGEDNSAVIVNANYHADLTGEMIVQEAEDAITMFPQRCLDFRNITKTIFGFED